MFTFNDSDIIDMRKEESAAIQIQYWWRRKLRKDEEIAEKARRIAEWKGLPIISLHNDELIGRLAALRRGKAYDMLKYEHILHMPARDVNTFLQKEAEIGHVPRLLEEEYSNAEEMRRHKAAVVIQRQFRSFHLEQLAKKYLHSIANIKPKERIEYIQQIAKQLDERKTFRRENVEDVKRQIETRKKLRSSDAEKYARRQMLIDDVRRDVTMLKDLPPISKIDESVVSRLHGCRPLTQFIAERRHRIKMEEIDDQLE